MHIISLLFLDLQNVSADTLANAASRFTPLNNGFPVEMLSRPSIPDNVMDWRVFDDDSQVINFLSNLTCSKAL
jgi:hypothetical protein